MTLTKEQLLKVKSAQTGEELQAAAKEEGLTFTEEEADCILRMIRTNGELSDEDLAMVSGGKGRSADEDYEFPKPRLMINDADPRCPNCGNPLKPSHGIQSTQYDHGWPYDIFVCGVCPYLKGTFRRYWKDSYWTYG